MSRTLIYDQVAKSLFSGQGSVKLNDKQEQVKKRLLIAYVKKLDDPLITDKDLVKLMVNTCGVSESQAYVDISHIERIFGNFRTANKEFIRHIVNETQKRTIKYEERRLKENPKYSSKSLSYAVAVLVKANGLDKDDPNLPDWENIQPPMIEASDDVTILDLKDVEEESVERIRKKFMIKRKDIEDAEIVD